MKKSSLAFLLLVAGALASCNQHPKNDRLPERPLLFLTSTDVTTFDPQIPFEAESGYVLSNIFDTLVEFDSSFRPAPGLALRWTNPDDRTWRFYLNPNARFSDGSKLRASDVRFSLMRLKSLTNSELQAFTEHISSVNVVNETVIDITTDTPTSILNDLVFIPILSEKHVTAAGEKIDSSPVGTGPYRLSKWNKGKEIDLEANDYYRPAPAIRKVRFVISPGDADERLQDILRLKPDVAVTLAFRKMEEFQKKASQELKLASAHGISVWYLAFSLKRTIAGIKGPNPMADARVRKAVAYALDRKELIRAVLKSYGREATQLVAPEIFGYDPDLQPLPYDPAKGKQLIEEAGLTNAEIPIYTTEGGTHIFENSVIQQWEKIGVKGKLVILKNVEELNKGLETCDVPVSLQGYSCSSGDASEALTFCLHTKDDQKGYGKGNYSCYSNPEIDRIAQENLRILNPRQRLQILQQSFHIAGEDLPYLPVLIFDDVYVVSNRVRWKPPVSGDIRIRSMAFLPVDGQN